MNCAAIIMRTELSRAADAAVRREENGTRKNRIIYGNYNYTARTGTENNNMAKISGLGRGLENIFSDNAVEERNDITKLKITQIEPRSDQPRKDFDPESLAQLADSIAAHGVLQPLLVRESGDGFYEIIAGERRWRASKLAGLTEVPVIVIEADELKAAQVALIENIQREDLNPIEEAMAYAELIRSYGMRQEDAARQLGKSRSAVANAMRLLDLPDEVLDMIKSGELSAGHGRTLLALNDKSRMGPLVQKIVKRHLSVREAEAAVRRENRAAAGEREGDDMTYPLKVDYFADLERRATSLCGRQVKIMISKNRHRIEVEYSDNEDLEELLRKICGDGISEN